MAFAPLFRFAVIADTHVNPSEHDRISPFESHRLANERMRHTIRTLNALRPAFVVHVGDMVHPVPEAVSYGEAVEQFRAAVAGLDCPIHLVAGNHDVGDKVSDYVPAGSIRPQYVDLYSRHFGRHFYSFDAHGCHFAVINTSLINSGLQQEREQAAWLEKDLARGRGARTFVFMHYPPFVAMQDEPGHYDNIDQPGRGWLLDVLARHEVEAVFTGHVHNFFLNRHGAANLYLMPSTAFARADYTEIFRTGQPPGNENGRNDTAKLGIMLMDVYADRVVPRFIRTLAAGGSGDAPAQAQRDWPRLAPMAGPLPAMGIELRHGWTALHDIPYSSMLDEFGRKQARNDYPILALWEMGVRSLRVPLADLLQEASRARMEALASLGMRFTVFLFGWPGERELACLRAHRQWLAALELIVKWPPPDDLAARLREIGERAGLPLALSRFWNASGESRDGRQIKLLVDHGFVPGGDDKCADLAARLEPGAAHALVFRVARGMPAHAAIAQAVADAGRAGLRAQIHVRLADDSPAQGRLDEWSNACRTLEAALCSHYHRGHAVFLDTLEDVDRGYFPRVGLIDRLCNPRLAGRALRNLNGALSELPPLDELRWQTSAEGLLGLARAGGTRLALALKARAGGSWRIEPPPGWSPSGGRRIDLGARGDFTDTQDGHGLRCADDELVLWVSDQASANT